MPGKRKHEDISPNDVVMQEADPQKLAEEEAKEEKKDKNYSDSMRRHLNSYPTSSATTRFQDAEDARKTSRELSRELETLGL